MELIGPPLPNFVIRLTPVHTSTYNVGLFLESQRDMEVAISVSAGSGKEIELVN